MKTAKLLMLSICIVALSSCNEEVLGLNRTDAFSDVAVWSSKDNADLYLVGAYNTFREISNVGAFEKNFTDGMSDLFKDTGWYSHDNGMNIALLMDTGFNSSSAGIFECWDNCYNRIRICNTMILDIERYGSKFGEQWCAERRAEVRFCRAYNYYRLARVYGGVPLRTENSGSLGGLSDGAVPEDLQMERASEMDTYRFILEDLSYSAEHLPEYWPSKWKGRATKLSAWAFISRLALYTEDWELVRTAADKCKSLGAALAPDYSALFDASKGQDNSREVLFATYYLQGKLAHNYDRRMRPLGDSQTYGIECYAYFCPTEELVSLYEWADGTPFSWDSWQAEGHPDPYSEREPRFQATVLYHGAQWDGRTIDISAGGADRYSEFELQTGNVMGCTCTGYYTRKYLQESNSSFPTKYSDQCDNVIRYAEVLLNKAEACAQMGELTEGTKALNEVRERVELPARNPSGKEELMDLVRRERCVELAGEGLRYWDLRRWKIAHSVIDGKNVTGTIVEGSPEAPVYTRVDADGGAKRIFPEKYYYFAIPVAEISNNKLCDQNPLW